jgi:hypothetical protein
MVTRLKDYHLDTKFTKVWLTYFFTQLRATYLSMGYLSTYNLPT